MRTRNRRKGFTLIELMIVVAIIALLIAILLPSLARARQQAMQVACAANLNAIHKGMFYYSEDPGNGNGYLPQLGWLIESDGGWGYWTGQISKYVVIKRTRAGSRDGLTVCPAHEKPQLRHITGVLAGTEATLATPGGSPPWTSCRVAGSSRLSDLGPRTIGSSKPAALASPSGLAGPMRLSRSCVCCGLRTTSAFRAGTLR